MNERKWRDSLVVGDLVQICERGFKPLVGEVTKVTKAHIWVGSWRYCREDGIESAVRGSNNGIGRHWIRKPDDE